MPTSDCVDITEATDAGQQDSGIAVLTVSDKAAALLEADSSARNIALQADAKTTVLRAVDKAVALQAGDKTTVLVSSSKIASVSAEDKTSAFTTSALITAFQSTDTTLIPRVSEVCFNVVFPLTTRHYRILTPAGAINGSNTTFTLPISVIASKLEVLVNGISIHSSSWSITGGTTLTVSFPSPLISGDMLWAYYWEDWDS
jgi:hypothetical protein